MSLSDFTNFHGMLCGIGAARRCIAAFDGRILFLPDHYNRETLHCYDYTTRRAAADQQDDGTAAGHPKAAAAPLPLSVASYYFLVAASLTGLSSLCGWTKCLEAEEFLQNDAASTIIDETAAMASVHFPSRIRVEAFIWKNLSAGPLHLVRRFEYQFGGPVRLQVMMLHIQSANDKKLHLVEVFYIESPIVRRVVNGIQTLLHQVFTVVKGKQC